MEAKPLRSTLLSARQGESFQNPGKAALCLLSSAQEGLLKGERLSEPIQTREFLLGTRS